MPSPSSVITKKLPGNVEICAHVVSSLHLLSGYATEEQLRYLIGLSSINKLTLITWP